MSARHHCEASTWRHDAHFATVVRDCCRGCRCRFRRPEVGAAGTDACLFSSSSSLLLLLCCCRPAAVETPYGRRQNGWLHAETAGDYKRGYRSWQTGFNSLIVQLVWFFLGPTDVQPVAICLIWCRVVQSRDVRSRDFSAPVYGTVLSSELIVFGWLTGNTGMSNNAV